MKPHRIWRHGDFMKLWMATTISQMGTQISFLAMPLIAVLDLHASPAGVSALNAIEFLPSIIFGLFAGVWADRLRRRPIMIASDLLRAFVLLAIPILSLLGSMHLWQLYLVNFLVGAFSVFFDVAYQSYLPSLIKREQLIEGNAALEISNSGSRVAGPSMTGLLLALVSAPFAVLFDALSFIGSAILLMFIRREEEPPLPPSKNNQSHRSLQFLKEIREGINYVFQQRTLRSFASYSATINFGWCIIEGIFMIYAVRTLGLGAGMIGIVLTISNIGLIAGAAFSKMIARRIGVGKTLLISCALQGVGILLLPMATNFTPLPFLIAGLLFRSFGVVVYGINSVSLRQAITPEEMQGRVTATMRFMSWSVIPIGYLLGGILATYFELRTTVWIGSLVCLFAFAIIVWSPIRKVQSIPEDRNTPI